MDECGGVQIHFPTESSGSDNVTIRGLKEDVKKAKQQLTQLAKQKVNISNILLANVVRNSSNGQMVRASASGAVDSSLIPSLVKPMALKLVFTASLLDVQALKRQCGKHAGKFACRVAGKGTFYSFDLLFMSVLHS